MQTFHLSIEHLRHANAEVGAIMENIEIPSAFSLISIEKHASKIYTRNVFNCEKAYPKTRFVCKVNEIRSDNAVKFFIDKFERPELTWKLKINNHSSVVKF